MITDADTNLVCLSDKLPGNATFYEAFVDILTRRGIPFRLLPGTNDIWAVDYMPVQIDRSRFVRFTYRPDYLVNSKKYRSTITDTDKVCERLGLEITKSDILLDGGNVIRGGDWVVMTDKIFKENPHYEKHTLLARLEAYFDARVIIVPREPGDFTGHADGMVRYYDKDTVLVNRYSPDDRTAFQRKLSNVLKAAHLDSIAIPYNPYQNKRADEAHGVYINFLQMHDLVVVPLFGLKEDEEAVKQFGELFGAQNVEALDCRSISKDGGVLNCVTWNVMDVK